MLQGIEDPVLPSTADDHLPGRRSHEQHASSDLPDRRRDELRAGWELLSSVGLEVLPSIKLEVLPSDGLEVLPAEDYVLLGSVD